MTQAWVALVMVAFFAAIMGALWWAGVRVRRRGHGSLGEAFMGPFEEIWHPGAHRARAETQIVEEHMTPRPSQDPQLPPRSG